MMSERSTIESLVVGERHFGVRWIKVRGEGKKEFRASFAIDRRHQMD